MKRERGDRKKRYAVVVLVAVEGKPVLEGGYQCGCKDVSGGRDWSSGIQQGKVGLGGTGEGGGERNWWKRRWERCRW